MRPSTICIAWRSWRAALCLHLGSHVLWAATPPVELESVKRCDARHEETRSLQIAKRLFEARIAGRQCAQESCPGLIRSDCSAWLREIDQAVPTIVVVAESDRGPETAVRVSVDGQLVSQRLGSEPIELEPGIHRFRLELSGYPPMEQVLELAEGVKNRVVRVRFSSGKPAPASSLEPGSKPSRDSIRAWSQPAAKPRTIPPVSLALAALSVGALATAGYLYLDAGAHYNTAVHECAPYCGTNSTRPIDNRYVFGHLASATSAAAAGLALYFYFGPRPVERPSNSPPAKISVAGDPWPELRIQGTW